MKIILISKKYLFLSVIAFITILLTIFLEFKQNSTISVFNPIKNNTNVDLNADGVADIIEQSNNKAQIKINNSTFILNSYLKNDTLSSAPTSWPAKIFFRNLSRSLTPEIIIQSNCNNISSVSILCWTGDGYKKIYSEDKNIFGMLNTKNGKTPIAYSIQSSKGNSSLKSFMILNNEIIDITKFQSTLPSLDNIITFIGLIEKNYEIDETPNIFSNNINSNELGILWNLDKEHNRYSFQDAFFMDDFTDSDGNITSILWRITFEKYNIASGDSSKKEKVFFVSTQLESDGSFKISGITTN